MKTVTFTEFRKDASSLLTEVEQGASLIIYRHGKPIAEIIPYTDTPDSPPHWKEPGLRLKIDGASLAQAIMAEREEDEKRI
jgi:prevent-host-death family protein